MAVSAWLATMLLSVCGPVWDRVRNATQSPFNLERSWLIVSPCRNWVNMYLKKTEEPERLVSDLKEDFGDGINLIRLLDAILLVRYCPALSICDASSLHCTVTQSM